MPLGMEDRRILSGHLRASSSYNYNHGPDRARLNIYASHGRTGAWVAKYRNVRQWLQIDLRQLSIIKGIATQGRREAHQFVKSYTISYSVKGLRFRMYSAFGRVKVRTVKLTCLDTKQQGNSLWVILWRCSYVCRETRFTCDHSQQTKMKELFNLPTEVLFSCKLL